MEAILYAEVYLICIVGLAIQFVWPGSNDTRSTMELRMRQMLGCFLVNFTFNLLFTLCNGILPLATLRAPLSYLFKTLYFVSLAIGVCGWYDYALAVEQSKDRAVTGLRGNLPMYLMAAAGIVIPVVNLFTGWLFTIGEDGTYTRHFLFTVYMLLMTGFTCMGSIKVIRRMRKEADPSERAHMTAVACFPLCLLMALILSCFGEEIPVIVVALTVELLCICLGSTKREISMDSLTQINNRNNLIGFMNYKLRNHSGDLYLIMLDVDDFKAINDTYGHLEGDKALVETAGVLKRSCGEMPGRPYIARYGGDEFIIVMEGSAEDVQRLCATIDAKLEESNRKEQDRRWKLRLSYGFACWQEGMDNKAFVNAADENLYRNKKARKRETGRTVGR